jgi:hypothetical protein
MSIDRHGINRNASSALSKSSFEESVDMLINASIFSEYDNTSGVSPQVMLGKVPNCGSGNFDIILDEEHFMELIKNVKQTKCKWQIVYHKAKKRILIGWRQLVILIKRWISRLLIRFSEGEQRHLQRILVKRLRQKRLLHPEK